MKTLAVIVFVMVAHTAFGQLDSIHVSLPLDTLRTLTTQIDSIKNDAQQRVDSVTQSYHMALTKIQNVGTSYQRKVDSLTNLNLPTEKYTQKIDSLQQELNQTKQKAEAKIQSIKQQTTEKLNELPLPPELQQRVTQVTNALDKVELPSLSGDFKSPVDLGKMNGALEGLPSVDLPSVKDLPTVDGLSNVTDKVGDISGVSNDITGKVSEISQQAGDVVNAVKDPGQIDKLAENQLAQLDAVKSLQEAQGTLPAGGIPSEEEAKQELVEQVQQLAVDHFAGKQEILQAGMDKLAKYKEKYESLPSLDDAKKLRNTMKGKPFVERFVPGFTLQFQIKDDWWMDTYISAGYRITGKITAGTGWNQRIAYNFGSGKFNAQAKIYGIRNYGEFYLKKGFTARGEVEWMNAYITPAKQTTDVGQREWVVGVFTGIKKDYRFLKGVKGNVQMMYNIWDPKDKSPYADRFNVRMGFEFLLKKKRTAGKPK